jgi:VanZ family protein
VASLPATAPPAARPLHLHRSAATPFTLLYALLIVYASLYPFVDWRDQGLWAFEFLTAPWPRYWSRFDTIANFLGYAPLGFVATLALLRSTLLPWPLLWTMVAAAGLSLGLEALQTFLPQRVPALSDWLLNTAGALLGGMLAHGLERWGAIDHWSRFRSRWFSPDARASLVLLAVWPVALLFPPAIPMALGQVFERLNAALEIAFADTPFADWLPASYVKLQPLAPLGEALCVMLGLWAACLLGLAMIPHVRRRALFLIAACAVSVWTSGLSSALSYGPESMWAWLSPPVQAGLAAGMLAALMSLWLGRRACLALLLMALVLQLALVNLSPSTPYFAQTLQDWEQGRFIRFHGLAQWLGWLWPYAALWVALVRLTRSERPVH